MIFRNIYCDYKIMKRFL